MTGRSRGATSRLTEIEPYGV
ncbi:MAG: hypothetical protein QOH46_2326, partial [Solirubrobacteraceae bacterium]|nr:hypothetical protein [Solirubrobacteraceae bacterium]